jgi:hypothetical protein
MFCSEAESCLRDCEQGEHHWCAECKYGGCDWCCGCDECSKHKRGGWSPEGVQIRHGGAWDRVLLTLPALPAGGSEES